MNGNLKLTNKIKKHIKATKNKNLRYFILTLHYLINFVNVIIKSKGMKTKLMLLITLFTLQFGYSQSQTKIDSIKIVQAKLDAEAKILKAEKEYEKNQQKELEKAEKEAKKAEKEQKEAAKKQKEAEKELKNAEKEREKIDNATKDVARTESNLKKAKADLNDEKKKYEKKKLKGKLSPEDDIKYREKLLKKENKINKLGLELEKDRKKVSKLLK